MLTQYSKDMERVVKALDLCRTLHEGQVDKCGQPYWIHPFTVAMTGFNQNNLSHVVVGLLHDIPEDTETTIETLENLVELTEEEVEALKLLTHSKDISYDEYIDLIVNSGNKIAISVKLRDLAHNFNLHRFVDAQIPITYLDEKRAMKYKDKYIYILGGTLGEVI